MAIIIDSGADVALSPLSMADHGEGELEYSAKTKRKNFSAAAGPGPQPAPSHPPAAGPDRTISPKVGKFPCVALRDVKYFSKRM